MATKNERKNLSFLLPFFGLSLFMLTSVIVRNNVTLALDAIRLLAIPSLCSLQVPVTAPNKNKTNLDEKSKFVLFFTRDYFGLIVKLK